MEIAIICVLVLILIILICYVIRIKSQLKKIRDTLNKTKNDGYNKQIDVDFVDSDLTNMASEMNSNLDYQKKLKYEIDSSRHVLKQSISDMAHDLRTPLTIVKGNLQMLSESNLSDNQKEYVGTCDKQTDYLRHMVDDFFELSVLESEDIPLTLSRINITNLLMEFIADEENVIRQHGLEPRLHFYDKTVYAYADSESLLRILNNLLNNVMKYANDWFELKLQVDDIHSTCSITISNPVDTSSGIDINNLFERTYRGSASRSGSGAGLGLYIVKLLADKQNMKLDATCRDDILSICVRINMNID